MRERQRNRRDDYAVELPAGHPVVEAGAGAARGQSRAVIWRLYRFKVAFVTLGPRSVTRLGVSVCAAIRFSPLSTCAARGREGAGPTSRSP